ncbi:MAG: hypothetical protein Ta2B_14070 [Termitinemataceae bacterium]|nr:MAG: hypothetical protein Ta2B_14070 [Termitinemataceae bacterium]
MILQNQFKRLFYVPALMGVLLILHSCFLGVPLEKADSDFHGPVQNMSFWATVKMGSGFAARYEISRIYVMDEEKTIKIGQSIGSFGYGEDRRFKIALPESYMGKEMTFALDLQVKNSGFDNLQAFVYSVEQLEDKLGGAKINLPQNMFDFINDYPIVLGIIKSRYISLDISKYHYKIPNAGETLNLDIVGETVTVGYGPGSLQLTDLNDIKQVPPIFIIDDEKLTAAVDSFGFNLAAIIATESPSITPDYDSILGITAPELDWVFVFTNSLHPGDSVHLWYIFTAPAEGHACPCGPSCLKSGCEPGRTVTYTPPPPYAVPTTIPLDPPCSYSMFNDLVFLASDGPPGEDSVLLPWDFDSDGPFFKQGTEIIVYPMTSDDLKFADSVMPILFNCDHL